MVNAKFYRITLAIAGILQAAWLVESLANTGQADHIMMETQLRSLMATDPKDFISVYGTEAHMQKGLELVKDMFDPKNGRSNSGAMHYLMAIIYLQDKLSRNKTMLTDIGKQLAQIPHRLNHFDILHPSIIDNFSDIYQSTVSSYQYRIQVAGKKLYLEQATIVAMVRALLLSGIRSAMLWRQVGGTRFQFIFSRKKLVAQANQLLESIKTHARTTYH